MPKKFGINTKSAEARSRKEAAKQAEKEKKERELEDALWEDNDKHVLQKKKRKDEKDKKKQEQFEKKLANKAAYEEEMSTLKSAKVQPLKVTRAEISAKLEKDADKPSKKEMLHEVPLEENINRIVVEGDEARSVDDAIAILSLKDQQLDRHPERRVKAAYQAFEDANLPLLKAEHPNLRMSQLKQLLKKEWMKSPQNPLNQRNIAYNSKT